MKEIVPYHDSYGVVRYPEGFEECLEGLPIEKQLDFLGSAAAYTEIRHGTNEEKASMITAVPWMMMAVSNPLLSELGKLRGSWPQMCMEKRLPAWLRRAFVSQTMMNRMAADISVLDFTDISFAFPRTLIAAIKLNVIIIVIKKSAGGSFLRQIIFDPPGRRAR